MGEKLIHKSYQHESKEKISVIVILYHSKHLLENIITNIQIVIKGLGEIILVNNSQENINEFKKENIIILSPDSNLGYGSGLNLGISVSKYENLLLLNPDIDIKEFNLCLDDFNERFIISGHSPTMPGYSLKFPTLFNSIIEYSFLEIVHLKSLEKLNRYSRIKKMSKDILVDYVSGALIFTNKTTFKIIGGFDKSFFLFYEETDFCKRAFNLNIPVISTSRIVYKIKDGKSSSKNVNDIKIKSGINSCKIYHLKYSGIIATHTTFIILKLLYVFLIMFLSPFALVNTKSRGKIKELKMRLKYF